MRPDPTRQRIALFGNFGSGNLGNEATLQAMLYNLRRHLPNAEIKCICPEPENTALQYNISAVPIRAPFPIWKLVGVSNNDDEPGGGSSGTISATATEPHRRIRAFGKLRALRMCAYPFVDAYRWFKGIASLRNRNALIMTGTGMLSDFSASPFGLRASPFGLHYDIFRWAVIAKLCRCKLLFVSVGGGPIHHPLSKYFVKAALALAHYRSYRDASSKDHLEAIGVDVTNDAVYPDLAFSLPRAVPVNHDPGQQGIVVGVGLMNYFGRFETIYREYIQRLASFVVRLLERRYTVRILIGDFVCDQGLRRDLRTLLEERGCNYEDGSIIDEPAFSVDELLSQLASVDVVVSSRFHNLLLGLMLKKPVVAISYQEKFKALMDGVGLGDFCQDIEHIDVDDLIAKVISTQENAPGITSRIAPKTESYRAALDEQYVRILEVICSA
jgi:polysaccharide pyruvyl transferase WcaK-like protein